MKKRNICLSSLIALVALSCNNSVVFEGYHAIPDEEWCRTEIAEFKVEIPEAGRYMVSLCLRHTSDYEMANLWCFMETRGVMPKSYRDTVNIKVAEPDGRWLGEGGAIKTLEQPLKSKIVELPKGTLSVRLEQGMRIECLKGVKDIGIKIIHAGN